MLADYSHLNFLAETSELGSSQPRWARADARAGPGACFCLAYVCTRTYKPALELTLDFASSKEIEPMEVENLLWNLDQTRLQNGESRVEWLRMTLAMENPNSGITWFLIYTFTPQLNGLYLECGSIGISMLAPTFKHFTPLTVILLRTQVQGAAAWDYVSCSPSNNLTKKGEWGIAVCSFIFLVKDK